MVIPITQPPSDEWLAEATQICQIFTHAKDWKIGLNQAIPLIRKLVIFDNLIIYQADSTGKNISAVYARATGRGRSQGSEISWGEPFVRKVISANSPIIEQSSPEQPGPDRLEKPILMGIPLNHGNTHINALILIRFGSPLFDEKQVEIAQWIAEQIGALLEKRDLLKRIEILEEEHKQIRFQEDFVSTITHELRTPLGFIKGYTTTLLRSDTEWDATNRREFLTIIDQETDILQELIDNILDTARLQSHTMPIAFQAMRIDPIIRDVVTRINTQYPDRNIDCQLSDDTPPVEVDSRRLAQVLGNLVTNAIKYAPEASIYILTRKRAGGITIIIKDTGPGITREDLPHVFERFYRGSEARITHGSGLGLYICKQIIKSHHGRIIVTSSPGKGTTFTIYLPYKQPIKQERA